MKYDHYLIETQGKWEHTWVYRPFPHKRQNFPLLLQMAGYAKWCAGEIYERTHSTDFFVEYVRAGNVRFVQDGKEYLIQPGEAYLLRKGASHYYSTGPAGFVLKRFVQIAGSGLDYYLRALELWDQDRVRPQHPRTFECLLKRVTTLLAQSPSDSDTSDSDTPLDVEFSCLMYQLLLELNKAIQPSVPPIIEKALALMHERLHCSLSREEICESVGLSMSYFNKVFAEYMHCTPIAYFLDQKFNWTVQLLKTTSLSIKEIAYRAGFDDPLYFSAQFKKRYGISPTEYRKHEERIAEQKRHRGYHPCGTPGLPR